MRIKHFDDYHEIPDKRRLRESAIELGCFPPARDYPYCRYFALYYKGRRPKPETVLKMIRKKVRFGTFIVGGNDVGINEKGLLGDLKTALAS